MTATTEPVTLETIGERIADHVLGENPPDRQTIIAIVNAMMRRVGQPNSEQVKGEKRFIQYDEIIKRSYSEVLAHREEILKAFIAKYKCEPNEIEIVEQRMDDGLVWYVRKRTEALSAQPTASASAVIAEVMTERQRQAGKGFNAEWDDTAKTVEDWCNDIEAYVVWARQMHRMRSPEKYRRRMKQIAALAIAACESFDRKEKS